MVDQKRRQALNRLSFLIETIPDKIKAVSDQEFSFKSSPVKWSKKEILGHLIDSANVNINRLIRGQYEMTPGIGYDQDQWNRFSYHQQIEAALIITIWTAYNRQLIEIMGRVPDESLSRKVRIADDELTLEFIIVDYVDHLEHHLRQIVAY